MEDLVIADVMKDVFLPQGRYPENFVLISLMEVCQEGGGQEGGYMEDVGGFLTRDMADRVMNDIFLPQGRHPKNFVLISQLEVCQEGGSRRGVLGGRWGFLTGDVEDMVIPDVMNVFFLSLKIVCCFLK